MFSDVHLILLTEMLLKFNIACMKFGASYFANRIVRHVKTDMEKMADDGCTFVVHTMSEHDVTYHSGNMSDIVKASHDAGLEVFLDPWGIGRVFGGESFSAFVKVYPHCRQKLNFAEGDMMIYKACLNVKTFRDYMTNWIELAAKTGTDGVFLG